jgi:DNA repair photolyase
MTCARALSGYPPTIDAQTSIPTPPARGAGANPANRFEAQRLELEPGALLDDDGQPLPLRTIFFRDDTQSIIAWNNSPDIPFRAGCSPYRGCEHGCAYCYARPTHEYLGLSAGLDFESKILVKERAPELLRDELSARKWKPQMLAMSGVTDCYQPVERKLELTRRCLEVLAEFRNPVGIVTKNHLVTRDLDLLLVLARFRAITVAISITTLDGDLAKTLEPRASPPLRRLRAVAELSAAGIPVHVMMAPVIPGLTDHEMPALFAAAAEAGARDAHYVALRLPWGVAPLFEAWLERHAPGQKEKVLGRLRDMRGGKLYKAEFGERMRGTGFYAEQMKALYQVSRRRVGFPKAEGRWEVSTDAFRVPTPQMMLDL